MRTGELAFTQREYEKLLSVCNTLEDETMLQIAVSLGLRRTDLSRIRVADIDLENRSLIYFEHKKNRYRNVPLSPKLTQLIRKYLNSLPKKQEYVFSWGASRYGDRTAYRRLQSLCDRAGIPRRPFHTIRATCIKFCQKAGWSPEAVSELTGDTIRVIQEHYSTPSAQEMKEIVEEKEIIS